MGRLGSITTTRSLTVEQSKLTAGQLRAFLADAESEAKIQVSVDSPDRPGELSTLTVKIITEEISRSDD